jgi:hypothetical protein
LSWRTLYPIAQKRKIILLKIFLFPAELPVDLDKKSASTVFLEGVMKLLLVSSKDQIDDFFTKSLLLQPFGKSAKLRKVDIYHPPTCGRIF